MTTSASIITSTITSTLEGKGLNSYDYAPFVEPVVEALVERVYVVSELLLETAVAEGLDAVAAKNLIEGLGLSFRPEPEPEVEEEVAPNPGTLEERVDALAGTVDNLAGQVAQLVQLASSKLGVTL